MNDLLRLWDLGLGFDLMALELLDLIILAGTLPDVTSGPIFLDLWLRGDLLVDSCRRLRTLEVWAGLGIFISMKLLLEVISSVVSSE
jgi:hypothetical protein